MDVVCSTGKAEKSFCNYGFSSDEVAISIAFCSASIAEFRVTEIGYCIGKTNIDTGEASLDAHRTSFFIHLLCPDTKQSMTHGWIRSLVARNLFKVKGDEWSRTMSTRFVDV